ncbi:MAG: methyltransferase [Eubacteriales bacterium]|nr:methyltransferase [Clostridiales bacterium]MDY5835840.1 methyltransferase [Eubacteriales bacterium]
MAHYFDPDPEAAHSLRAFTEEVQGQVFRFISDAGTFSRNRLDFGSRQLLEAALDLGDFPPGCQILDLGCGWGPVGTILASFYPQAQLSFCDINERALRQAMENFNNNCPGQNAQFYLSDGLSQVPFKFDYIFLNPPIRAGKTVVYRLFAEAHAALNPGGKLMIVVQKKQGAKTTKDELERLFGGPDQVVDLARKAGYRVFLATKGIKAP